MVICKYYQQGTCRYGNNCRFEHVDYQTHPDSNYRGRYQYQGNNNYYSSHNKNPGSYKVNTSHDVEEVMKMIAQEIMQSDKGGQWPLSCFAPIKERQCFPGWEDHSPEEIRWRMYEALKNGTFPECQRQVKEIYEAAKMRRNSLLHPNEEMYKIIEKIMRGQKIETESSFSFVQAASQTSAPGNAFGMPVWNSSVFGNNQQQQQHQPSPPAIQQSASASNFTFSLPQFGGAVNQNTVPTVQPVNPFGSAMPIVPNVVNPGQSIFGNPPPLQTPSPFGVPVQNAPGFQQMVQPAEVSSFNNVPGPAFGASKSLFNTNADTTTTSAWNKPESAVVDTSLYAAKADLSEDELNAFLAKTFTMGKVPTKPPPKELCSSLL